MCAEWASMYLSAVVEEHRCKLFEHPWVSASQHMYLCIGEELQPYGGTLMYRCVSPLACKPLSMCFAVCMNVSVGEQVCELKDVCKDLLYRYCV